MFISIDGGDGTGKSGQIAFLKKRFEERGQKVAVFRDPGDTALGETIRSILLNREDLAICPTSETALFMASRAQLIREKIVPALESGATVIADRYLLSTVVYQGYAANRDVSAIWRVGRFFADDVLPDLTFVLDCPIEVAFQRLNRPKDRIESRGALYRQKVRDGFLQAVADWPQVAPGRAFIVDASRSPEETSRVILKRLAENGVVL